LMGQYRQLLTCLMHRAKEEKTIAHDADIASASVLFIGSIQGLVMQSMLSGHVAGMAELAPGVYAHFQRGLLTGTAA
jgi:TetR/AcrR family transcriptional regulator